MTTIHPWINFNGNAEEAFAFYASVFGGMVTTIVRFKDIASAEFQVPQEDEQKIMRMTLPIGGGCMLVGNDVPSFMGTVSEQENRSKIYVTTESREEARRIFTGLSAGGEVEATPDESENGAYFGAFRDVYGIEWIVELNAAA